MRQSEQRPWQALQVTPCLSCDPSVPSRDVSHGQAKYMMWKTEWFPTRPSVGRLDHDSLFSLRRCLILPLTHWFLELSLLIWSTSSQIPFLNYAFPAP